MFEAFRAMSRVIKCRCISRGLAIRKLMLESRRLRYWLRSMGLSIDGLADEQVVYGSNSGESTVDAPPSS